MDFSGFSEVFPNTVYAVHDYCGFGFPNRIGRYRGEPEQDVYIRKMYDRKVEFMKKHNVPIGMASLGPFTKDRKRIRIGRNIMRNAIRCLTSNCLFILLKELVSLELFL